MSLFLTIPDNASRVLRCWIDQEYEYLSSITGGKRYARLVIDRSKPCISVWTYAYPIKRMLDDAIKAARLNIWDCDIRVSCKGSGTQKRYEIRALSESMLTGNDMALIDQCTVQIQKVVK